MPQKVTKYKAKKKIELRSTLYRKGTVKSQKEWERALNWTPDFFNQNKDEFFTKVNITAKRKTKAVVSKQHISVQFLKKAMDAVILHTELIAVRNDKLKFIQRNDFDSAKVCNTREGEILKEFPSMESFKKMRNMLN